MGKKRSIHAARAVFCPALLRFDGRTGESGTRSMVEAQAALSASIVEPLRFDGRTFARFLFVNRRTACRASAMFLNRSHSFVADPARTPAFGISSVASSVKRYRLQSLPPCAMPPCRVFSMNPSASSRWSAAESVELLEMPACFISARVALMSPLLVRPSLRRKAK